jgi:hypothetical protein
MSFSQRCTLSQLAPFTQQIVDSELQLRKPVVRPDRAAGNDPNMASLIALPNELSDLIFEHLTTPEFISLSKTCKHLHARALPLSYKHLTLMWYNTSERTIKNPNTISLSNRLEANPELKNSVRRLTLETSECISFSDDGEVRVSIPGRECMSFYDTIRDIIVHCDRLERLDISIAFMIDDPCYFEKLMHSMKYMPGTKTLKHLHLTCDDTSQDDWVSNPGIAYDEFGMFFSLPHLETIEMDYFDPFDRYEAADAENEDEIEPSLWPLANPEVSEHLHTLRLACSPAPAFAFELILRETPKLRVFDIELYQHPATMWFNLDKLKTGLDHVQSTLTNIRIRYDVYLDEAYCISTADFYEILSGGLGSFHDYAALTHLEISLHVLFGVDDSLLDVFYPLSAVLPPNLETLVITDDLYRFGAFQGHFDDGNAMNIFKRFFEEEWREATPHLKQFMYDLRDRGDFSIGYWHQRKNRKELRALCKAQGIAGRVLWED